MMVMVVRFDESFVAKRIKCGSRLCAGWRMWLGVGAKTVFLCALRIKSHY